MANKLYMSKVLDAHNIKLVDDIEHIDPAGVLRLIATAAYHQVPGSEGRRRAEIGLDRLATAAAAKGFSKVDQLRSAFAEEYPPTVQAKTLADEMAACLGKEFFDSLSDPTEPGGA